MEDKGNSDKRKPINIFVPPSKHTTSFNTTDTPNIDQVTPELSTERTEFERLRAFRRGEGIELSPQAINRLLEERTFASSAIFRRLNIFKDELGDFFAGVRPTLPPKLRGELLNPDGTPAERIIVEVLRPVYSPNEGVSEISWAARKAVTDKRGIFSVQLSPVPVPQSGLVLRLRGQNTVTTLEVARVDAIDGNIGLTILERTLTPLQQSVVGELTDLVPVDDEDADENIEDFQSTQAPIVIGEGDCASEYKTEGGTVSRHRYSVLYRLIDPLVGPKIMTRDRVIGGARVPTTVPGRALARATYVASDVLIALGNADGEWNFRDRQPIEEPIDIDEFFDDLETDPQGVPKASSLGLGYVTKMRVVAINAGLSLGKLVYSLPLAPGEEQRVTVFEQREQLSVRERESLSFSEEQTFEESRDTSFDSTFSTALDEMVAGSSRFNTSASSSSKGFSGGVGGGIGGVIGGFFGGIAGGAGWTRGSSNSSSSGTAGSSQNTSRDFLSETSEAFSSSLERSAGVKRRSTRTGVRSATARDRQTATTKLIANRNHCHAMTMQWFEVLRDYSIETRVEGVQLVCFVPLQLIPFRQPGQPNTLPTGVNRPFLMHRYQMLLRYVSVLRKSFRGQRRRRAALELLEDFAADLQATPQNQINTAQDVIRFEVNGVFMSNDDISVIIITKDGDRIGPSPLAGQPVNIDTLYTDKAQNRDELIARLSETRRNGLNSATYEGALALPLSVDRSDIARIELRRRTGRFAYRFDGGNDAPTNAEIISDIIQNSAKDVDLAKAARAVDQLLNTSLSGGEFDDLVGAPLVTEVSATMNVGQPDAVNILNIDYTTSLPASLPLPVDAVASVLTRRDLIRIENMYQHVASNTVEFSKAVWAGMSDEERAILLERFTIGVPEGGLVDASSEVPLLSAVSNRVLGFYGNALIMPFHIPPDLAEAIEVNTADIQDALLRFHRDGFSPRRRKLSLPTQGLLGEAVLGRCNACEIIDHRRFWNWQDSPTPPPVGDAAVLPQGGADIFSATAPSLLATNQPQSNLTIAGGDVNTTPGSISQLAEVLKAAPDLAKGGADLTGLSELQKQLQAETASVAAGRDKAIDTATDLTKNLVSQATTLAAKAQGFAVASQQEQTAEEEKKDADEKIKAETDKKARTKRIGEIAAQAESVSALAGAQDDPPAFAASIISGLPGGADSLAKAENILDTAKLFGAFTKVNSESAEGSAQKSGSAAFLESFSVSAD